MADGTDNGMAEDARREILARLRHSTSGAGIEAISAERDALPVPPGAPLLDAFLPRAFLARVLLNGGTIAVAQSRRGAVDAIGEFVAIRHGQRRVVAGHDPRLAALPWRDGGLLPRFGCAEAQDAVAISYARCAVAETGSTLLWRDRDNPASNNLLPEDHVVLVDSESLVPRLEDCWPDALVRNVEARPRAAMLVSGPSSTADIALQMVMGAHGPRAWHVVLLGPELEATLAGEAATLAAAQ